MPANWGRQIQARAERQQLDEDRQHDLNQRLRQDNMYKIQSEQDLRVEAKRRDRAEAAERRELFMDHHHLQAEQEKVRKREIAEFEERLADELEKRKCEEARENAHRQKIVDSSHEIRTLKEKLNAAAANKVRARQMLERQEREAMEMEKEAHMHARLEEKRLMEEEKFLFEEREKAMQKGKVKLINQEQIAWKEAAKQEAVIEYQRDRAQVEDLVAKLAAEDQAELDARQKKKLEVREMIRQYQQEAKDQRLQEERRQVEEDEEIAKHMRMKQELEDQVAAEKARVERERDRIHQELAAKKLKEQREAEEMERLREDLFFEEREAAERRKELLKAKQKLEIQEELLRDYKDHLKQKERSREEELAKEAQQREESLAKFAEDERVDQMNAQKRRLKLQEHRRELDSYFKDRKDRYDAERQKEREELERLKGEEDDRRRTVEEERAKLLKEFGGDLRDFLPKGALNKDSDYDLVGLNRPEKTTSQSAAIAARGDRKPPPFGPPLGRGKLRSDSPDPYAEAVAAAMGGSSSSHARDPNLGVNASNALNGYSEMNNAGSFSARAEQPRSNSRGNLRLDLGGIRPVYGQNSNSARGSGARASSRGPMHADGEGVASLLGGYGGGGFSARSHHSSRSSSTPAGQNGRRHSGSQSQRPGEDGGVGALLGQGLQGRSVAFQPPSRSSRECGQPFHPPARGGPPLPPSRGGGSGEGSSRSSRAAWA